MSTDYTPESHRMRDAAASSDWMDIGEVTPETIAQGYEAFDRMIAQVRAEAIRSARDGIMPPYNFELRYDGTEDPGSAAYAEIMHEVHDRLSEAAEQIEKEAGL